MHPNLLNSDNHLDIVHLPKLELHTNVLNTRIF
jgi:hypothetical protein